MFCYHVVNEKGTVIAGALIALDAAMVAAHSSGLRTLAIKEVSTDKVIAEYCNHRLVWQEDNRHLPLVAYHYIPS